MSDLAEKIIPLYSENTFFVQTGTVVSIEAGDIKVDISGRIKQARKAFSCVFDLKEGDVVTGVENNDTPFYVLGILKRPGSQDISLSFASDLNLRADRGGVTIKARDQVAIGSDRVTCVSEEVVHKSCKAYVSYDNVTACGNRIQASFKTVRLISDFINTMAKQVVDRFRGYVRYTENSDMVKSAQMTRQIKGLYALDSKHTIMNSKKSTKIDGEKILMG